MSQPQHPSPPSSTSASMSSQSHGRSTASNTSPLSYSGRGSASGKAQSVQQSPTTLRSLSVPAPQQVVQLVQMTAQATRLQPVLVSVLSRVQEIEKDFQTQEEKLKKEKEDVIAHLQNREQDLEAWKQHEQYKLDEQRHQLEVDETAFKHRMEWEKGKIQEEEVRLNRMKTEGDKIMGRQEPVTVEVGGEKFRTELSTLTNIRCRESILPNLVTALERRNEVSQRDGPNKPKRDPYIFIDRDGKHFKFILNYLRQGEQVMRGTALRNADKHVLQEILYEVRYYQLFELERLVVRKMASLEKPIAFNMLITAHLFVRLQSQPPASPPKYKYITAKDVTVKGKNLSRIEFNQVIFEHPVTFDGCLLVGAVFRECHFKDIIKFVTTDLTGARFENCEGVQISLRFCFENAITQDMEFIPPLDTSD